MSETFEAIVRNITSDGHGESGLHLHLEVPKGRDRFHRLDVGDEALKHFHIGQKVRVTVEAVEE